MDACQKVVETDFRRIPTSLNVQHSSRSSNAVQLNRGYICHFESLRSSKTGDSTPEMLKAYLHRRPLGGESN